VKKEDAMKYMLLIHLGDAPRPRREGETNEQAVAAWENLSDDERKQISGEYQTINQTPGVSPGLQLEPAGAGKTVRIEGGKTFVTDGPFAETKEALGGYLVFEADDIEAALELAARIPTTRMGGAVEVRPVVEW
jgi:hypothetical protein